MIILGRNILSYVGGVDSALRCQTPLDFLGYVPVMYTLLLVWFILPVIVLIKTQRILLFNVIGPLTVFEFLRICTVLKACKKAID